MRITALPLVISFVLWHATPSPADPPGLDMSLVAILARLETGDSISERIQATEALTRYGRSAVPPLVELLRSTDSNTRYYAVLALNRLGPAAADALPDLTTIAADRNDQARIAAIGALGRMGAAAKDAVPILFQATMSGDPTVQSRASASLAEIGTCAVPVLLEKLRSDDLAEVQSVCEILACMGSRAEVAVPVLVSIADKATESEREAIFVALAGIGPSVREDLIRILRHKDGDMRRLAAKALGGLGTQAAPAASALYQAIHDEDANVRFWVVWALGEIGGSGPELADCLMLASLDSEADVRWQTAVILRKVHIGEAENEVRNNLLKDPHPAVRAEAERIRSQ